MLTFRQSQATAVRRRWMFQLTSEPINGEVPAGTKDGANKTFTLAYTPDSNTVVITLNGQVLAAGGVDYSLSGSTITMVTAPLNTDTLLASYVTSALTGQTGTGWLSKNGAAAVATTNSMVEVDATNMPGFYYIELTAGELDTAGFLGFRVKTTSSLNFEDKALITYDDPYAFHGGFPVGSSKTDMQKLNWAKLLQMIRQAVKEELATVPADDDSEENSKLDKILEVVSAEKPEKETDLQPVLTAIAKIKIPASKDYAKNFSALAAAISALPQVDVAGFAEAVKEFEDKMGLAAGNVNTSLSGFADIQKGFTDLQARMDELTAKMAEMNDMDKRFDAMTSAKNNQQLEELAKNMKDMQRQLLTALVNYKFDILKSLR